MKSKTSLWVPVASIISLSLNGQILNIDKTDTSGYSHKTKIFLHLSTGLEIDKQKTTLYDAANTAEVMWQEYKELFILAASYRLTYNGPDDILDAGYIHLRYRHGYKNRIQPEPFLQYQWDNNRSIVFRDLAGFNLRYNFTDEDRFTFSAGLGPMYEKEKWNYNGVDSFKIPLNALPINKNLFKINSYLRFDWKPNGATTLHSILFCKQE